MIIETRTQKGVKYMSCPLLKYFNLLSQQWIDRRKKSRRTTQESQNPDIVWHLTHKTQC